MASFDFDPKSGRYHIRFRYGGKPYKRSLKLDGGREAHRVCGVVEETIKDLMRGRLAMPDGSDPGSFLISGGTVASKPKPASVSGQACQKPEVPPTLGRIFDTYRSNLTPGSKEANSLGTEAVHGRHFKRLLGEERRFDTLSVEVLQSYVDDRSREGVVRDTIRKELATIRVVWGWAFKRGHISTPVSWKPGDLTLPKSREKPPFQTWAQITRRIERGGLSDGQREELWESLWLNQAETLECLAWARENAKHPFVFPMFAFAAYTGARRGELLRSERDDWDLDAGVVAIRQKKADRSREFTRRVVPIHHDLTKTMRAWFEDHPGGPWTIADSEGCPIGERMATKYFRGTLKGGKWRVLRGFHAFRHSLASNMASAGVDQRVINAILGHSTVEMERRYRHLLPSRQEHAINALFGEVPA